MEGVKKFTDPGTFSEKYDVYVDISEKANQLQKSINNLITTFAPSRGIDPDDEHLDSLLPGELSNLFKINKMLSYPDGIGLKIEDAALQGFIDGILAAQRLSLEEEPLFGDLAREVTANIRNLIGTVVGTALTEAQRNIWLGFTAEMEKDVDQVASVHYLCWTSIGVSTTDKGWGGVFEDRLQFIEGSMGTVTFTASDKSILNAETLLEKFQTFKDVGCKGVHACESCQRFVSSARCQGPDALGGTKQKPIRGTYAFWEICYLLTRPGDLKFTMAVSQEVEESILELEHTNELGTEILQLFREKTIPSGPPWMAMYADAVNMGPRVEECSDDDTPASPVQPVVEEPD
ncbi:MAG: hypothetical protein LBQ23_01415 [Puniceicoccales bacterium]|jgi:hypothetical protein|nr:hypothetical protein [Puniceicoccales bacterium]